LPLGFKRLRNIIWVEHVAIMGSVNSDGKYGRNSSLGRLRYIMDDSIKIGVKERGL
jgi:hypothetical protein